MAASKHQTYFELREALERVGCVACRLSARSVRRYLAALSFESVNDYGLRGHLRRARGFCNLHAWQLLDDVRDPFGAGIIYRDVLNHCADLLGAGRIAELAAEQRCLACEARAESEARYVDVLGEHLDEAPFASALVRAGGLCWRHFAMGLARGGRGVKRLAELELGVLRAEPKGMVAGAESAPPAPGVRAGNAAPRPASDEIVGDPVVALAVGLPGVAGLAVGELAARDRGRALGGDGAGWAAVRADGECGVCGAAGAAVEAAIGRLPLLGDGALELCSPHAWRAVELVGVEAVRARLRPALEHLLERIEGVEGDLARAAPVALGPVELTLPWVRRLRGELAVRLAPGGGCAVCAAQLVGEVQVDARGPVCRPHLRGPNTGALDRWREIVADLDEYIRKNDYRFRDEPRGDEQRAPWRAVAAAAGARSVR